MCVLDTWSIKQEKMLACVKSYIVQNCSPVLIDISTDAISTNYQIVSIIKVI